MENYTENSYMPQKLYVRNSGNCGLNDEPMSLVPDDDRLSQNLLILAYKKPVTITELAKKIGIPTAYIENIINKLTDGELMKRMGDGKVYTDFIIYDPEDSIKYIKDHEQFASDNAAMFCEPMEKAIEKLKSSDFYSERLERYMIINIASSAQWNSLQPHVRPQIFPERPYGGAWIAFGSRYPENYKIPDEKKGKEEYSLSGQRDIQIDEYLGSKNKATITRVIPEPTSHPITLILLL
jgi:RNA polymerase sigma-70 factor (ECF subfamily)